MKVQILNEAFSFDKFASVKKKRRIAKGTRLEVIAAVRKNPAFRDKQRYCIDFNDKVSLATFAFIEIDSNAEYISLIIPITPSETYSLTGYEWDDEDREKIVDIFDKSLSLALKSIDLDSDDFDELENSFRALFATLASRYGMKKARSINYGYRSLD